MTQEAETGELPAIPDRWTLIRDIGVFQVKLLFDGFRDLLLVPVSLVVGLISLLKGSSQPGTGFYDLLLLGRRSERWINLFGSAERVHGPPGDHEKFEAEDIDALASRVEAFVVEEYRKGGVTAQAKEQLDRAFDTLSNMARRRRKTDD